jgi:exodeoxyribonuclease VII small subunit
LTEPPNPQQPSGLPTFEEALERLEATVRRLEDGEIGLSEALAHYEHGVSLLKTCYQLLENAERRIELLSGIDAEGKAVTGPFDDRATLETEQPPASRGRRHSKTVGKSSPSGGETPDPSAASDVDEFGGLF